MVRNMSVVSAQLDVVYGATINIGEIVLYKIHGTRVMVLWCDIAQEGTTLDHTPYVIHIIKHSSQTCTH